MLNFKPITGRKIRIALVGLGRISKNHIDAIAQYPDDLELTAVCDAYKPNLEKASTELQVPGYETLEDLLNKENCDLVTLCTPSGLHATQTIAAARTGKHVMTEKPIAIRWNDGVRMVRECEAADVQLFVVMQNRLNPPLQLLKQAIDTGRFGKIYMINLNVFWARSQAYYDQAKWRGTWEFDGGAFMNQASHYMDLLHWLMGPIDTIHAMMGTLGRKIEAEDTGVLNVRWRSGALGSVNVTTLTHGNDFEGSITILGENGTVRIGGIALNEILHWQFDQEKPEDKNANNVSYQTTSVYGFSHPPYYKNVIEVLRGKGDPLANGYSGLKTLELIIASYLSARDHREVGIPLEF